ncbi:hypothetical protein BDN71DRAFT_1433725 [Pleurotus eryngii]|uniref:Uncharacterized protein n=1 Tax=Pleurotus eryngii TaxID=5323 RepID=A0A9P5ZQK9_PLEER|nr:hypothetical protein BDN71DRAFT_1433725 [Pleurotus eryngii]
MTVHDMNESRSLQHFLGLPQESGSEEVGDALSNAVLSAASDSESSNALDSILRTLEKEDHTHVVQTLDVFSIFNSLLTSTKTKAHDILLLMGQHSSSKELLIVIQEAVERLQGSIQSESDFTDQPSPTIQLAVLVKLYSLCEPSSVLETHYIFSLALRLCASEATHEDALVLVRNVFQMIRSVLIWIQGMDGCSSDVITSCTTQLRALADATVVSYHPSFRFSVAQRSFQRSFPRLILPSAKRFDSYDQDPAVRLIQDTYSSLGRSFSTLPEQPSIEFLVLVSHQLPSPIDPSLLLSNLMPIFLLSVRQNVALDESLAILIAALNQSASSGNAAKLSPEIVTPLCTLLPPLACGHPDASTRYLIYKILSLLLSLSQPQLRLEILRDLTSSESAPQMRIAAIGLIKDAIFEGLSSPFPDLFASPALFSGLGTILLRPDPPNFCSDCDYGQMSESPEPSRLVQCLSLYYAVLLRDQKNLTGIRDPAMIDQVKKSLLTPIRTLTERLSDEELTHDELLHQNIHLVPLQIGLERVDSAIQQILNDRQL